MVFSSGRTFQFWDYHVSHARLLIRSPRSKDRPENQDIIFYGVEHLDLPTIFRGLEIETVPSPGGGLPDQSSVYTTYRLTSEGRPHHLTAVACQILENDLGLFDSSLDPPYAERPREELGRVLARA